MFSYSIVLIPEAMQVSIFGSDVVYAEDGLCTNKINFKILGHNSSNKGELEFN